VQGITVCNVYSRKQARKGQFDNGTARLWGAPISETIMSTTTTIRSNGPDHVQPLWHITVFLLFLAGALLGGCQSGGSSGGGDGDTEDAQALGSADVGQASIAGSWSIHEQVDGIGCGNGTYEDEYQISVVQDGSHITVTAPLDAYPYEAQFLGTVDGNHVQWNGEYPEEGGTTSVDNLSVTVDGNTLSGMASWTWSDGQFSCAGTTQVSGQRVSAAPTSETTSQEDSNVDSTSDSARLADETTAPNDTLADAQALGVITDDGQVTVAGEITDDGDFADVYTVVVDHTLDVSVSLSFADSTAADLDLALFIDGEEVGGSIGTGSTEQDSVEVVAGDTLQIVVYAYSGASRYELVVSTEAQGGDSTGSGSSGDAEGSDGGYTSIGSGSSNGGNTGTYHHEIWDAANAGGMNFNVTPW